jgi:hypothetical protein
MTNAPDLTASTFVSETLVTDTFTYEIVRRSAKSLWIRRTHDAGPGIKDMNVDGATSEGCPPVIWTPQASNLDAPVVRVGLRKDGTYRTAVWANPLRPCDMVEGQPCRRTDYRM